MKEITKSIQVKLSRDDTPMDIAEEHSKISSLLANLPASAWGREEAQALNELAILLGLLRHHQTHHLPIKDVLADILQVVSELLGDVPFQALARLREEEAWVWRHMCQTLASDPEGLAKVHAEAKEKYPDLDLKELGFQTNATSHESAELV